MVKHCVGIVTTGVGEETDDFNLIIKNLINKDVFKVIDIISNALADSGYVDFKPEFSINGYCGNCLLCYFTYKGELRSLSVYFEHGKDYVDLTEDYSDCIFFRLSNWGNAEEIIKLLLDAFETYGTRYFIPDDSLDYVQRYD